MALLNPPNILPPVAEIAFAYLLQAKDQSEDYERLKSLLAPASLGQGEAGEAGSKPLHNTLLACDKIGVFTKEGDTVAINAELPKEARDKKRGEGLFRRTLRERVLARENTEDPWASDVASRDLARAVAWFLTQDPLRAPRLQWKPQNAPLAKKPPRWVEDVQTEHLGTEAEKWVIRNDTRWGPFLRWSTYLGFVYRCRLADSPPVLMPDPTEALRDIVPGVFGDTEDMQFPEFLAHLANRVPVLDGGWLRRDVEDRLPKALLPPPGTCSRSLSFALLRLQDDGLLKIENRKGDSEKRQLYLADKVTEPQSHVVWSGR